MKKFFKFVFKAGLVAGAVVVALQFQPVRDAVSKLGIEM